MSISSSSAFERLCPDALVLEPEDDLFLLAPPLRTQNGSFVGGSESSRASKVRTAGARILPYCSGFDRPLQGEHGIRPQCHVLAIQAAKNGGFQPSTGGRDFEGEVVGRREFISHVVIVKSTMCRIFAPANWPNSKLSHTKAYPGELQMLLFGIAALLSPLTGGRLRTSTRKKP